MKTLTILTALALLNGCQPCNAHTLEEMTGEEVATLVILGEARCQGQIGQRAVAQVILNRARKLDMPREEAVKAVCLAPYQFSCVPSIFTRSGALKAESSRATEQAETIAAFICHDIDVGKELVGDADHYYNPSLCRPRWSKHGRNKVQILDHLFMEL